MEEALLSIEKRRSEGEIASIIWALGRELRRLSDRDRGKVANAVMRLLNVKKASIAKCIWASALLNTIMDATRPIVISEAREAMSIDVVVGEREADSDDDVTI